MQQKIVFKSKGLNCSGLFYLPDRDRRIAVHCAGGYRSSIAISILHRYGITDLVEMAGGLAAWDAAKLPVVSEA